MVSYSAALLAQAWQYYQANQFYQAEQTCLQILQEDAGHIETLHLLALIAQQTGRADVAFAYLHQALAWQPTNAMCHFQLALTHDALGQLDQAIASYRQAVALQPDFPQAYNNLGSALQRCGQLEEAATYLQMAVALRPNYVKAYLNLGAIWAAHGRLDEAVDCYRWLLQLEPDSAEVYCNLGVALEHQGKLAEAAASYQAALRLQPHLVEALFNLGNVLKEQDQLEDAAACYRQALALQPTHVQAHNNLGIVLHKQSRRQEAIQHFQTALELKPQDPDALTNLGALLTDQGELDEAQRYHEEALRLKPDHAGAHCNFGLVLHRRGQPEEALERYEEALRLAPGCADAHWNRSLVWLQQGNFEQGWPEYEWRWHSQGKLFPFPQPLWDGSDLTGRTILLHTEQGLGDVLQFIRYAPLVKQRGGTVFVQCHAVLKRLLTSCPGIDLLIARGEPIPPFDVQVPLLGLPEIFGTTVATIPANVPYLRAEPELVEHWREVLAAKLTRSASEGAAPEPLRARRANIGIVWQGNSRERAIPLAAFAPLGRLAGVRLISLQKGQGREQLANLSEKFPVLDLADQLDEASGPFMDTAAVMPNLDLVVTADTAIAHLAGALATRAWVALAKVADWRWFLDRTDSPWYPSMRLFRQQQAGDWNAVFEQMALEIQRELCA